MPASRPKGSSNSGWTGPSGIARLAVAAVAAALVAGCEGSSGFRPLYGSLGSGAGVEQKLAHVEITPIGSRIGQILRNELIFQTTRGGAAAAPLYRLDIAVRQTNTNTLVERDGNTASGAVLLEAKFELIRLSDKQIVLSGNSLARAPFERFSSTYGNVKSGEDAAARAAKAIATDMTARLSAYMSSTT